VSDEPRAPGVRAFVRRPDVRAGLAVFGVMLVGSIVRNRWIFTDARIEDGDFAVNSILIDQAKHLTLLVGNYSRVGFNHPGPALLYVQAAGEFLFHDLLPLAAAPYNAHVLAILCLSSSMVALSAAIVVRRVGHLFGAGLVLLCALAIGVLEPGTVVSTWFPDIYIWPFLLLVISAAAILSGAADELPCFVLATGLLCHGHVSFFLFAAGFGVAVAVAILSRPRDRSPSRNTLLASGGIALAFTVPFALNLLLHWPGELDDYWRYSRGSNTGGHSFGAVLTFVRHYWSGADRHGGLVAIGLVVAAFLLVMTAQPRTRRFGCGLLGAMLLSTVLLIVYARRGVDDLSFRYVGEFYVSAPIAVLLAVGLTGIDIVRTWRVPSLAIWGAIGVSCLALVAMPEYTARYPGANWLSQAEDFLDRRVDPSTVRVMRFPLEVWPGVAGIVEQSRRSGDRVCIEEPAYGFLFDESMICTADEREHGTIVEGSLPGEQGDAVLRDRYESPNIVLEILPRS
jgi:hypothetical protein